MICFLRCRTPAERAREFRSITEILSKQRRFPVSPGFLGVHGPNYCLGAAMIAARLRIVRRPKLKVSLRQAIALSRPERLLDIGIRLGLDRQKLANRIIVNDMMTSSNRRRLRNFRTFLFAMVHNEHNQL